jgi:polyisoprenoid-binding protein YceI
MDFNPWLSSDGTLYLSLVLFSQFDCKAPVFQKKIIGSWQGYRNLFQQAAGVMEDTVARIIQDPESGDSFDPVGKNTPQTSWKNIGFPLPQAPKETTAASKVSTKIPHNWILAKSDPDDAPMIQFRFPAPLDNYAGEVKSAKGEFSLSNNLTLNSAKGFIEIDTRTAITMGDPVLDEAIRGSMLLDTKNFPAAGFVVENISGDGLPLAYGGLSPAAVTGIFTLKGKKIPLSAIMEFEPVIGEDGKPRLLIRGAFKKAPTVRPRQDIFCCLISILFLKKGCLGLEGLNQAQAANKNSAGYGCPDSCLCLLRAVFRPIRRPGLSDH